MIKNENELKLLNNYMKVISNLDISRKTLDIHKDLYHIIFDPINILNKLFSTKMIIKLFFTHLKIDEINEKIIFLLYLIELLQNNYDTSIPLKNKYLFINFNKKGIFVLNKWVHYFLIT
jgi:hypothetical protein